MLTIKTILPVLILISIFFGCETNNPVMLDNMNKGLIPIAKGNTWYYSGISYDSLGNITGNFDEIHDVRGDTILFGKKLTFYSGHFITYTDSGIIRYGGYSISSKTPKDTIVHYELLFKYPASVGDSYGYGRKIGAVDTTITVPAGTFKCVKYMSYSNGNLYYDDYICYGVGLIKSVNYYRDYYKNNPSQVSSVIELTTYKLN